MKPSIKKLHNVFNLEAERGYDNGAVVGGLERLIGTWEAEARLDGVSEPLIQAVIARLRDYVRLSPNSRREALKGLWGRVRREEKLETATDTTLGGGPTKEAGPPITRKPSLSEAPAAESVRATPSVEKPAPTPNRAAVTPPEDLAEERPPSETTAAPAPAEAPLPRPGGQSAEVAAQEPAKPSPAAPAPTPSPATSSGRMPAAAAQPAALDAPVTVLDGVGERYARTLERLGLVTLGDMLYHFPRRYDDYTRIKPINRLWYGEEVTVIGTIQNVSSRTIHNRRLRLVEALVSDGSGSLRITWFNQPWIARRLRSGMLVVLSGKIEQYLGRLTMNNPEWELLEKENLHTNRIVPVYPLTARLTQRWLRRLMYKVVTYWAPRVQDPLPETIRSQAGLMDLSTALLQVHCPSSWDRLKAARYRLAFDEIFLLQLGVLQQKKNWQDRPTRAFTVSEDWVAAQIRRLPYTLTGAQQRALNDVRTDLASGRPMNRLLQGDVGSGKTVIAALAIAIVAQGGAQSALMAPTSILAEQHFRHLRSLLTGEGGVLAEEELRLMVGATPEGEKAAIREALARGEVKLVVGTHALIEDPVTFQELRLAIIDEQHRFGVRQRAALRAKGEELHLLVMTATPIPRSLSLTIYGDLDLTVIDELPPGRQEVETHVLYPRERERAYTLIRSQAARGFQTFIIYPLVEESDNRETLAAVEDHRRLQEEVFPDLSVGLLHGRLKADEKEQAMARFRDGQHHILVSTSVVEVGVDIPNATVMLIEGANHFGLAQLHQFRGRVGRGSDKAYCLLIPDSEDAAENERLQAMVETNDGFVLAERDLEQRGPGEFLGTRQSGFGDLRMARLTDVQLIEQARRYAQQVFNTDPALTDPVHNTLAQALQQFWGTGEGDIS